ncbi:hypothetical protein L6452_09353 [Arctium lappa]|uniref:Uncharacterized protein n=1 Tax=Arctium lappa TaxID=4217 RepID=A0ACB9DK95_ARCLA|nr:hypothetical protein L6452_09353 [Arctium lappa]
MADVTSKKLLLFVALLLVVPLFVRSLETGHSTSVRRLLKHSQPPKTTMAATAAATTTHAEFHAAAHEVPSGPNPESNRLIGVREASHHGWEAFALNIVYTDITYETERSFKD